MIMMPADHPREGKLREQTMRIMVVTDQYEPMVGGVPTVTRNLARGLAGRGHDVALVHGTKACGSAACQPPRRAS